MWVLRDLLAVSSSFVEESTWEKCPGELRKMWCGLSARPWLAFPKNLVVPEAWGNMARGENQRMTPRKNVADSRSEAKDSRGPWFSLRARRGEDLSREVTCSETPVVREIFLPPGSRLLEGLPLPEARPSGEGLSAAFVSREPGTLVAAAAGVLCLGDGSRRAVVVARPGRADDAMLSVEALFLQGLEEELLGQEAFYLEGVEAEVDEGGEAKVEATCLFGE